MSRGGPAPHSLGPFTGEEDRPYRPCFEQALKIELEIPGYGPTVAAGCAWHLAGPQLPQL